MNNLADLADALLSQFTLEEILEMNNIEEAESLLILLERGLISQPEHILQQYELEADYEEEFPD